MFVATFCYKQEVPFNVDYYRSHHVPLTERVLGPLGLQRVEMIEIIGSATGAPAPYHAIVSLYFESPEAFKAAMKDPSARALADDVKNFYEGRPEVLLGRAG